MQIELKINPADIEKQVTEAIVASAFGEQLKRAIDDALKSMGSAYSWDSQLKKYVENEMRKIIESVIDREYKATIEEKLREKLTPELLQTTCDAVITEGMRNVKIARSW